MKAKHPSAQTRAEILRWRASHPGLSCRQIGARFGVSGLTVHRVLLAASDNCVSEFAQRAMSQDPIAAARTAA